MGLLKQAVNQTAFLKAGFYGFEGSGKTYTAVQMAIGLSLLLKKKEPKVAFFDTETGSDFHIDRFKKNGIRLDVTKSRAFTDLCEVIREAESGDYSCLIIDSISHVWKELMASYLRKKNRSFISLPDWGVLKGEWSTFTDLYVNSKLHILMLGRAANTYDEAVNEATGKRESVKSGTKMRVEAETGYEPSLLVEMERVKSREKKGWDHLAVILKDRTDRMNGNEILNPGFDDFKPVIDFLNLGGEHVGVDTTRTSEEMFQSPDRTWEHKKQTHQIEIERLDEVLTLVGLAGSSADVKKRRTEVLKKTFGQSSRTFLENKLPTAELKAGIDKIDISYAGDQA